MKQIYGIFNTSNTDANAFMDNISDNIRKLQDDGQEVEIQYSTDYTDYACGNTVIYSALIIGRK